MELKDKINYLLKAIKKSRFVILDGVICCCNKHETFEYRDEIDTIFFDDAEEDDHYKLINIDKIKDIELVNGTFKIIFDRNINNYSIIRTAVRKAI
jgi:hypothetical protein